MGRLRPTHEPVDQGIELELEGLEEVDPVALGMPAAAGDRRGLHAVRLRARNGSTRAITDPVTQVEVVTAGGRHVDADLLFDLGPLVPGSHAEGWLVFFLAPGESVATLALTGPQNGVWRWELELAP